jgi:hypothetical protein
MTGSPARSLARGARVALAIGMLVVIAAISAGPARAAGPAPSTITIEPLSPVTIGQEVLVIAHFTSKGSPVTSRLLTLSLDGKELRTGSVDSKGMAVIPIRPAELSEAHSARVTVSYPGSHALAAASASATLVVRPAVVTITTVPALDGIPIRVGDLNATTKDGVATFKVPKVGTYQIAPDIAAAATDSVRADFVRWSDNIFTATRNVQVDGDLSLQLGLHIAYRVSLTFTSSTGTFINPQAIQSVTLTSSSGAQMVVTNYQNLWLEAGTAVKRQDLLEASPRTWRLLDVQMAGTNVVNRGQQRLEPAPNAIFELNVLLYNLQVAAHDALFGTNLDGSIQLDYPDGTNVTAQLTGPDASASFSQLPRGDYVLRLRTAGILSPTPVVLSSDQSTVIRVLTYVDLVVFGTLGLLLVLVLLWFGRREVLVRSWAEARALPGRGADRLVQAAHGGGAAARSTALAAFQVASARLGRQGLAGRAAGGMRMRGEALRSYATRTLVSARGRMHDELLRVRGAPPASASAPAPTPSSRPARSRPSRASRSSSGARAPAASAPSRRTRASTGSAAGPASRAKADTVRATGSTKATNAAKDTKKAGVAKGRRAASATPAQSTKAAKTAKDTKKAGVAKAGSARATRSTKAVKTAKDTKKAGVGKCRSAGPATAAGSMKGARPTTTARTGRLATGTKATRPARAGKAAASTRAGARPSTTRARKPAASAGPGRRSTRAAAAPRGRANGKSAAGGAAKRTPGPRPAPATPHRARAGRPALTVLGPMDGPELPGKAASVAEIILGTFKPDIVVNGYEPAPPGDITPREHPSECPSCRRPVPERALFCRSCGARLSQVG